MSCMELGLSLGKLQEEHKAGGETKVTGRRRLSLSMGLGLGLTNNHTKSEIQESKDGEDDDDDDDDDDDESQSETYEDGYQAQNPLQLSLLLPLHSHSLPVPVPGPAFSTDNGAGGGSWDNGGSGLDLDVNKLPVPVAAVEEAASSANSDVGLGSTFHLDKMEMEEGGRKRKKLRLSKQQSGILEESFKEHNTLNPKQKAALAKHLNLRPRQVEVWFQNRRARTKLKQTQLDCDYLNNCCQALTQENTQLHKELQELRALKATSNPFPVYATTLTVCPSCSCSSSSSASAHPKPPFAFYPPS